MYLFTQESRIIETGGMTLHGIPQCFTVHTTRDSNTRGIHSYWQWIRTSVPSVRVVRPSIIITNITLQESAEYWH